MKRNKIFFILLIISLIFNIVFVSMYCYERNNTTKLRKAWDLATNNAIFLYQQYDERKISEAYNYAYGEIDTICNIITFFDYGKNHKVSKSQIAEVESFYQNLVSRQVVMKEHIAEIRGIVQLLREEDYEAFIKMTELREKINQQ